MPSVSANGHRHVSWLRYAREERCLSQRELAYTAGVTQATVCRAERGDRTPIPRTKRALAAALDYRVREVFPPPGKASSAPELRRAYLEDRPTRRKARA
jgi:transcriptional regulator with XRE-family HTH domain